MLKIDNLSYAYPGGEKILKNITLELPRIDILAILGTSGSGKTTLLKCIGRFLNPQEGQILYQDKNINDIPNVKLRETIGIIFQQLYLFPHLTVLENMTLAPIKVENKPEKAAIEEAMYMLEKLGIDSIHSRYPSQISGGQAQRVAIARGLVLKPAYLLLDEPTSALDINTTEDFANWLISLKEDTTFIVVTHDVYFAKRVASSGVLLEDGKIKSLGTIDQILNDIKLPD